MIKVKIIHIFILATLFLSSCSSFTSLQTAELVGKDSLNITIAGNLVASYPEFPDAIYEETVQFLPQILLRKGISDKSELQALLSGNAINFNYKHSLFLKNNFIGAYSMGLGYSFFASNYDDQIHVVDLPLSLYLSYKPFSNLSINLNPKVLYRQIADEANFILGSSLNFGIGKKNIVYPEGHLFYDVVSGTIFVGGGFAFSF